MQRLAVLLSVLLIAAPAFAQCKTASPASRVFQFNPMTGQWSFRDACTGQTRKGAGEVKRDGHVWTITDDALLAIWDDRNKFGLAAVFPKENSDQWNPVSSRFVITFRLLSKGRIN